MIRGNIEAVTHQLVEGWIYTEDGKIREKLVLAFVGEQCVGSGRVSVFRSDLADAGIGDGYLGFSFPITVEPETVGSVVIKIDGSDAALLQPGAFVKTGSVISLSLDHAILTQELSALKWALKHCRISQTDFDFLRILWSFGVYERGLLRRNEHGDPTLTDAPLSIATSLLESYIGTDAHIDIIPGVNTVNFKDHLSDIACNPNLVPVVALATKTRAVVQVAEGSHLAGQAELRNARGITPSVQYIVSPENLVMLDTRVTAEISLPASKSIDIITATVAKVQRDRLG